MNARIRFNERAVAAAVLGLSLAATVEAHHSPVMFDRETPVAVTGTVIRFEFSAPHSFLYVRQQTANGPVEWAIEGPSPIQFERRGMDGNMFSVGDAIEACGYTLKEPATTGKYAGKSVLLAEIMVLPGSEPMLWSPYGNDQCRVKKGYVVGSR